MNWFQMLIIHSLSHSCRFLFSLFFFFSFQNCIFLDSCTETGWCTCYLQLCARFKWVFFLNVKVQRSRSAALNAMPTTRGTTSGNASNCSGGNWHLWQKSSARWWLWGLEEERGDWSYVCVCVCWCVDDHGSFLKSHNIFFIIHF